MIPFLALVLLACPNAALDSAAPVDSAATDSGSDDTAVDECADAAVVDWDNFGQGFLLMACQGCHASTTPERYGAPDDVTFDTVEQAWDRASDILRVAAGETPTMPPRGGVEDDDRVRLVWWLSCGTPGS
ncbi:MAG: hypothetical protein FJ090_14140 [Deltaproteobacteria bacterium]|nr:hypothetical protein [Deltaproteobacteria bacterium]